MPLNNANTLGSLDFANKEFYYKSKIRTQMGTLHSRQNIQNNIKGHEQINYQRRNFLS
jgi:hypothetical protein